MKYAQVRYTILILFIRLITQCSQCFLSSDTDQTQRRVQHQMTVMTHALLFLDHSIYCLITHPICFLLCVIWEFGIWGWVVMSALRAPLWEVDSHSWKLASKNNLTPQLVWAGLELIISIHAAFALCQDSLTVTNKTLRGRESQFLLRVIVSYSSFISWRMSRSAEELRIRRWIWIIFQDGKLSRW